MPISTIRDTEGHHAIGKPCANLLPANTPRQDWRQLMFATCRDTKKYSNLRQNSRVSVLVDGGKTSRSGVQEGFVVTAIVQTQDISADQHPAAMQAHLHRHPDLASFLQSSDCARVGVAVEAYQVIGNINDVRWWTVDDLNTP